MAIALESFTRTPSSGHPGDSEGSATIARPAGVVEGEFLLVTLSNSPTSSAASAYTSSGWQAAAFFGGVFPSAVMWKIATGSEPTSYSFTKVGTSATDQFTVHMSRWSGVDTFDPFAVNPVQTMTTTTGVNIVAPTITIPTGLADSAVMCTTMIAMRWDNSGDMPTESVSTPSGMTQLVTSGPHSGWLRMGSFYEARSSGSTGTRTSTLNGGDPGNDNKRGISFALRPSDGDPEPPAGPEPGRFLLAV